MEKHYKKQYEILSAVSASNLEEIVLKYLDDGWSLQGGVTVDDDFFYQALTKTTI